VVVGGGVVAQRKVTGLLRSGAVVKVISPTVTKRLAAYARQGAIRVVDRTFRPSDVRGAWLVCAATDDQAINHLVFRTATRHRVFTNVVDQPALCSFIAPAIAKRGDLVVAVSTGGTSPSLAKQVRSDLIRQLGSDYTRMLRLLRSLRGIAKQQLSSYADRKRYFDRLVNGRVFVLVRAGKTEAARHEALSLLEQATDRNGTR